METKLQSLLSPTHSCSSPSPLAGWILGGLRKVNRRLTCSAGCGQGGLEESMVAVQGDP